MSDVLNPMDLSTPKGSAALEIVRLLKNSGYEALFAGGCVRDYLLGSIPTDYDIATSATPDQVEKLFSKTIPVGKQFGVMLVLIGDNQFEVATFRTEGGYQDGRRPGFVQFSSAQEDASRRDFTINGLFYDPISFKVLDYVDGLKDLKHRVIRCIGEPDKRFEEDKLRLLRAIRFSSRLDFNIDPSTWNAIRNHAPEIATVSKERIREEIDKIATGTRSREGLSLLLSSGLWNVLIPQVSSSSLDLYGYIVSPSSSLACATLFFDLPPAESLDLMQRLRYSNEVIKKTQNIIYLNGRFDSFAMIRKGEFAVLCHDPDFHDALKLYQARVKAMQTPALNLDSIVQSQREWDHKSYPAPFLNGSDLLAIGIAAGPQLGKILEVAFYEQLEGKFDNKVSALNWVKSQFLK